MRRYEGVGGLITDTVIKAIKGETSRKKKKKHGELVMQRRASIRFIYAFLSACFED